MNLQPFRAMIQAYQKKDATLFRILTALIDSIIQLTPVTKGFASFTATATVAGAGYWAWETETTPDSQVFFLRNITFYNITIQQAGMYQIHLAVLLATAAGVVTLYINDIAYAKCTVAAGESATLSCAAYLNIGDFINVGNSAGDRVGDTVNSSKIWILGV